MWTLALAVMVQQGALPPVSPGLCLATANRLEGMVSAIRGALDDEEAGLRQGRKSPYTSERLERMTEVAEVDAANVRKTKARYARAVPSDGDLTQAGKMRSTESARYVAACAA